MPRRRKRPWWDFRNWRFWVVAPLVMIQAGAVGWFAFDTWVYATALNQDYPAATSTTNAPPQPSIGLLARSPESFASAEFTQNNPSLDLAPEQNGTLRGVLRISLQEIHQRSQDGAIGLVLPRSAKVEVGDAGGSTVVSLQKSANKDGYWITCDVAHYGRDPRIMDARQVFAAWGNSDPGGQWDFECSGAVMTTWYHFPKDRNAETVSSQIDGSNIETIAVAMAVFEIPEYAGIRQTGSDSWHFHLTLDNGGRKDPPLQRGMEKVTKDAVSRTVVSIAAGGDNLSLTNLTPTSYSMVPKPFYERGPTATWVIPFDTASMSFDADINDDQAARWSKWNENWYWVFAGYVVTSSVGIVTILVQWRERARERARHAR